MRSFLLMPISITPDGYRDWSSRDFTARFMPLHRPSICAAFCFLTPDIFRKKMRPSTIASRRRNTIRRCRSTPWKRRNNASPVQASEFRRAKSSVRRDLVSVRSRRPHPRLFNGGDFADGSGKDHPDCSSPATSAACATAKISPGRVLRSGPTENERCDYLVMESTYGNREHPHDDPKPELAALIRSTVQRGGSVVIPGIRRGAHSEAAVHAEGIDGVGADSARAGSRRQPHGHQGGASLSQVRGRIQS